MARAAQERGLIYGLWFEPERVVAGTTVHKEHPEWCLADQAALWGCSQYLPNNCIVAHLNKLDDYAFPSTLASSLCLGWIADAPDFDAARGKQLLDRYRAVRHLLVGAWYPLLPYTRDPRQWLACQFHRPDLNEGLVLVFRRAESPYNSAKSCFAVSNRERRMK